jgi:hypothetical protein
LRGYLVSLRVPAKGLEVQSALNLYDLVAVRSGTAGAGKGKGKGFGKGACEGACLTLHFERPKNVRLLAVGFVCLFVCFVSLRLYWPLRECALGPSARCAVR